MAGLIEDLMAVEPKGLKAIQAADEALQPGAELRHGHKTFTEPDPTTGGRILKRNPSKAEELQRQFTSPASEETGDFGKALKTHIDSWFGKK